MAIDVRGAGRAGGRVVMHAGPLDVRSVPLRRGVIQGEGQTRGPRQQRADDFNQKTSGDVVGPLAGGRDGAVAGLIPAAEIGRPDLGGDSPAPQGKDGPEEQECEPGCGPTIESRGELGEPLVRYGERMS